MPDTVLSTLHSIISVLSTIELHAIIIPNLLDNLPKVVELGSHATPEPMFFNHYITVLLKVLGDLWVVAVAPRLAA